jgi:hypothetical protein
VFFQTTVNGRKLTVQFTVGVGRKLCDQFIDARNEKPPWLTKPCVHKVHHIEHHDVVSSGIFLDEYCDINPHQGTKQPLINFVEAMEV